MTARSSPLAALGVTVALLAIATLGRAPEPTPTTDAPIAPARPRAPARVDLNAAGVTELEALPRVGPALAARIVAHREAHGPFSSVDGLDDVPGVGPATLAALRSHVTVSAPDGDAGALPEAHAPR
jgi:competence ComEA-like helix-hairpin-helix protein